MSDDRVVFWCVWGAVATGAFMFAATLVLSLSSGGPLVGSILLSLAFPVFAFGGILGLPLGRDWWANRVERKLDGEWVTAIQAERVGMFNLDGVPWSEAPLPRRWHCCTPQTRGYINYFTEVQRCACGAMRYGRGHPWIERNSRKPGDRAVVL